MNNPIRYVIAALITLLFQVSVFAATSETLTITTYYPSPYGVYKELRAKRMAIGTNWYDTGTYPWDADGSCVGNEICSADLVVQGNAGIGTLKPGANLHVYSTASAPVIRLQNSNNTNGAYWADDNAGQVEFGTKDNRPLGFWTNNIERMRIGPNGELGVGVTAPSAKIEAVSSTGYRFSLSGSGGGQFWIANNAGDNSVYLEAFSADGASSATAFWLTGRYVTNVPDMYIMADRTHISGSLSVSGACIAGCDYVFKDDYKLMPFSQLRKYIKDNSHLPGVPSAEEMKNKGINVVEQDMVLLKKLEESYLYILQLEDRIKTLESKIEKVSKK